MSATVPTTAPPHAPAATDGRIRFQQPELPPVEEVLAYFERSVEQPERAGLVFAVRADRRDTLVGHADEHHLLPGTSEPEDEPAARAPALSGSERFSGVRSPSAARAAGASSSRPRTAVPTEAAAGRVSPTA
jgi:hypothetical protein